MHGVPSTDFAARLAEVLAKVPQPLMWVAFGGAFDFAHMVKMLSGGQPLPETRGEFLARARDLLHGMVFDAKYMAEHCGRAELCAGGLRTVASILGVPQLIPVPPSLAGPKSHTACCIFNVMRLVIHGGTSYDGLIDGRHMFAGATDRRNSHSTPAGPLNRPGAIHAKPLRSRQQHLFLRDPIASVLLAAAAASHFSQPAAR
ncbi:probable CCR4-associated factor 1 homolog 11 [Sorghum bicolor]|uniref:probable CCR4-associated factor 1 homolog 11 n=1 Tax=Sorghum bicolor TaxID=4558 RepID=UPI000B424D79|nr:probable CCR4-associated factor 1 homolog 11 [Sorghum bicolor]|eukprot:XP_021317840.1 probable CCR4-associated factor 1 homolog 11 [Sorghum bicolor]